MDLTAGVGADAVLECVGTDQSMQTAFAIARPGAMVGYVGVPHGVEVPLQSMFFRNVGMHGGSAPVRTYIPELMEDVLAGRIEHYAHTFRRLHSRLPAPGATTDPSPPG